MKKFIVLFMMVLAMMSCADSKTFERADGTKFVAEPYGWANYQSNKIEGVTYEACFENIVWDIVAIEEFEGDDEEWEEYDGEIYGKENDGRF